MPVSPHRPGRTGLRGFVLPFVTLTVLAGCRRQPEITTYVAPKDPPDEVEPEKPVVERPAPVNPTLTAALPSLTWTLPADWRNLGGDEMSASRFALPGDANVQITPLPLMAQDEPSLVNLWRHQIGLPLLSEADAIKALTELPVAGAIGKVFEIDGARDAAGKEFRIVTAFVHRENRTWFFKLQGPPATVDSQKPTFFEFIKSVKFEAAPKPTVAPAGTGSEVPGKPPEDWTVQTAGPMQTAKFSVPDKDASKAEVTVSIFPSDTGGPAANVQRWREQLGLPTADAAALNALIKPLPDAPDGTVMVDLENQGRALTGVIVPRAGRWFFYKLTGGTAAVAAAREAFLNYSKAGS